MTVQTKETRQYRWVLILLFLVFYTTDAASGYFSIYLNSIGYDKLQIGMLTAFASLCALVLQPYIGSIADRSKSKNLMLIGLLLVSAVAMAVLGLSKLFWYIFLIYTLLTVVRNAEHSLVDSITLEYTTANRIVYGPIRIMGCIGYAVMAFIAGAIANRSPSDTFLLYAGTAVATAVVVCFTPPSRGTQTGAKVNPMLIFKNKTLLLYTIFALVISMTKSFYFLFFSVYLTDTLGGSASDYGVILSIAAFTEIPFIFFLDKLIGRFGAKTVMVCAAALETLRWLLTGVIQSAQAQLWMQAVLGSANMVMNITMVMLVYRLMPPEQKTTGQTAYTMVVNFGSLLMGNLLGGAIANVTGIRNVFFLCAAVNVAAIIAFLLITRRGEPSAPSAIAKN